MGSKKKKKLYQVAVTERQIWTAVAHFHWECTGLYTLLHPVCGIHENWEKSTYCFVTPILGLELATSKMFGSKWKTGRQIYQTRCAQAIIFASMSTVPWTNEMQTANSEVDDYHWVVITRLSSHVSGHERISAAEPQLSLYGCNGPNIAWNGWHGNERTRQP